MKFLKPLYIVVIFASAVTGTFAALQKWYWTANRIGSVKDSGSFTASACLNLSSINTDVYSNTRSVEGQVGIGDVLYTDLAGTTPLNGGSTWWAFVITDGASGNVRGYKIDASGVVIDVTIASGHFAAFAYNSTTHTSNCSNTSFTEALYAADDDPDMYSNKKVFTSTGGATLSNGSYTASYASGGIATWTYSTSASASKIESIACCFTTPVANAGTDGTYETDDATIPLTGSGFDCNGTITYSWSRISGPNVPTITSATSAITTITGFITGTYVYRLTVTDNSSNTNTDDVTITVIPAFVGTPLKIIPDKRDVWDLCGADTRGRIGFIGDTSDAAVATVGHKNGAWLGGGWPWVDMDFDPLYNKFDADSNRSGFQNDTTYPYVQRDFTTPYFVGGLDSQGIVFINLGTTYNFHSFWWNDSGGVNLSNVAQIVIGSLEEARKAIFEFDENLAFGSPTIDYTIDQVSTKGWKHYDYLRVSGQFIVIRLNNVAGAGGIAGTPSNSGPGISNFVFYGLPDPVNVDTRININWAASLGCTDTTVARESSQGYVSATAWPTAGNYIRDTIFEAPITATSGSPTMNYQGTYLKTFATSGSPTNGVMDRSTTRPARGAMVVNLDPYVPSVFANGTPAGLWYDSSLFSRANIKNYTVNVTPNRRLLVSTSFNSVEHVPIDSLGADNRLDSSYDMYSELFVKIAAKLGPEQPNLSQGFGAMLSSADYESDAFPNRYAWNRIQALIPYNECNIGFRNGSIASSNYMNPFALRAFHDKLYREWHKVFTGPFYGQGLAAWKGRSFLQAQMLNNIRYMDLAHPLCDIVNVHVVCETGGVRALEPGVTDVLYSHAEFGGWRNEGAKAQTFLDTFSLVSGKCQKIIFSEIALSTNKQYTVRTDPGGSDAAVSTHGARPIYSSVDAHQYTPYESQGFMMINLWAHQDKVRGKVASVHYEYADAADTVSCFGGVDCYNNSDANDGVYNPFGTHYTPFFKGSYFITQEDQLWKGRYRVVQTQSDSINGQLRLLYRNVYTRDSFLVFVQWQDSIKPANNRTFTLYSDVTTCSNKTPSWPDFTFAGTTTSPTVTAGAITIRPTPEANYIFFKSTGLSNELDGIIPSAGHYFLLGGNKKVKP